MSTIKDVIYNRSSGYAGLTALVGASIYPVMAGQLDVRPYIVFSEVSDTTYETMGGGSNLVESVINFTIVADDPDKADDIYQQIKSCWRNYKGSVLGVNVKASIYQSVLDGYSEEILADVKQVTFKIFHDAG